jgi:hypothetical protein
MAKAKPATGGAFVINTVKDLETEIANLESRLQHAKTRLDGIIKVAEGSDLGTKPPAKKKGKATKASKASGAEKDYVPRPGSYGAYALEVMAGKAEMDRNDVAEAVKEKLRKGKYKEGSFEQTLVNLRKRKLITRIKGKHGFWKVVKKA